MSNNLLKCLFPCQYSTPFMVTYFTYNKTLSDTIYSNQVDPHYFDPSWSYVRILTDPLPSHQHTNPTPRTFHVSSGKVRLPRNTYLVDFTQTPWSSSGYTDSAPPSRLSSVVSGPSTSPGCTTIARYPWSTLHTKVVPDCTNPTGKHS